MSENGITIRIFIVAITILLFSPIITYVQGNSSHQEQITSDLFFRPYPVTNGEKVVWYEDNKIWVKNFTTSETYNISLDWRNNRVLSGDLLYYRVNSILYVHDFQKNVTSTEMKNYSGFNPPAIYGSKVLFFKNESIYQHNYNDGSEKRLINNVSYPPNPSIHQNNIAFQDKRNGNWDIYLFEIDTGRESRITENHLDQIEPLIYGENMIYTQLGEEIDYFYLYDLRSNEGRRLFPREPNMRDFNFEGNKFIFRNKLNGNWDIFLFDLSGNEIVPITNNSNIQFELDLFGDRLVWTDGENVKWPEKTNWTIQTIFFDIDKDGYGDTADKFPEDPTEWDDSDDDGYGDNWDSFPTNPSEWNDSDEDRRGDNSDVFPYDPSEWKDTDGDGWGDNSDDFPEDPDAWIDSDGDGWHDYIDHRPYDPTIWNDTDDDGINDIYDAFPLNPLEWNDTDGDGHGDNSDAFPMNLSEWIDSDLDGYGNNIDEFPYNGSEWIDSDGDGFGNNSDAFPFDRAASYDSDGDGYPDHWNFGQVGYNSTTGLTLDEYPDDPYRHAKYPKEEDEFGIVMLAPLLIIIFLLIGLFLFNKHLYLDEKLRGRGRE